jgi:hypothetical protein
MRWLLCHLGVHSWFVEHEDYVDDNGEDAPVLWEPGGTDYYCRCAHCPASKIESRRGVWLPLKYPKWSS